MIVERPGEKASRRREDARAFRSVYRNVKGRGQQDALARRALHCFKREDE
jgi:hypothetical protein